MRNQSKPTRTRLLAPKPVKVRCVSKVVFLKYTPKEDITVFELAQLMAEMHFIQQMGGIATPEEDLPKVEKELGTAFRHFTLDESGRDLLGTTAMRLPFMRGT